MIEDELRAAFARNENKTPELGELRRAIDKAAARRRQKHWGVPAGAAALAVVVALLAAPALLNRSVPGVGTLIGNPPAPTGALDFLLLGLDGQRSPGSDPSNNRADSITIVHIPADRSGVYLVSLPRDLKVSIPGQGTGKLNESFHAGGQRLTTDVVEHLTGVELDGTAAVTLPAIREMADAVGGVRVCLPAPVESMHRAGVVYPKGCHELSGQEVADLLRQRKTLPLGALGRDDNAHRVLAGLLAKAADLDVVELARLSRIDGVTFDLAGLELASVMSLGAQVDVAAVVGLGQPSFNSEVVGGRVFEVLPQPAAAELFQALRQDTLDRFVAAHPDWVTAIQR